MAGSTTNWITETLCPLLGVVICNVMWASPLLLVLDARRSHSIGKINPIPFAMVVVNCVGWVIFSVVKSDFFLFFANFLGILIGLFFCTTSLQLLAFEQPKRKSEAHDEDEMGEFEDSAHTRKLIEYVLLIGLAVWLLVSFVLFILFHGRYQHTSQLIVGSLCDVTSILYFAAPMSTMREVIRTNDSSSLYAPTIFVNLLNALMWFFYGLIGVPDMNVWIPNGLGAILSIIQLVLAFVYRSQEVGVGKYSSIHTDLLVNDKLIAKSPGKGKMPGSPSRPSFV